MRRIYKPASDNWPYIAVGALLAIAVTAVWFYAVLSTV
jgi:hypothetical protein